MFYAMQGDQARELLLEVLGQRVVGRALISEFGVPTDGHHRHRIQQ